MAYTPEIRKCPVCGKDFPAFSASRRYCSDECYLKAQALRLKGNRCGTSPHVAENASGKKRRCHDCGRPTNNYRCEYCWNKKRGFGKSGVQYRGNDGMDTVKPYFF